MVFITACMAHASTQRFYSGSWPNYLRRVCLVKSQLRVLCADDKSILWWGWEKGSPRPAPDLKQQRPLLLRANEHCLPSTQYGGHCHQPVHLVKKSQRNRILQPMLGASRNTWSGPFSRNQHRMSRVLETAFWADEISVRPEGIMLPQKTKDPWSITSWLESLIGNLSQSHSA